MTQQNATFGVIISTGRSQLNLYWIMLVSGEMTSIAQSWLMYRTNCPSTNPLSKTGMCPRPSQNEHWILSVRDADTNVSPNWRLKDIVRLGWDFCRSHCIFRGTWSWKVYVLNLLPGVLVLHKAWKAEVHEDGDRQERTMASWWLELHPGYLLPDYSPNPRLLNYSQYTSILWLV